MKTCFFIQNLVSNHFDQIGSGTPFYERIGVLGSFQAGNLLRTPKKSFLLTKIRGKNFFFFEKKSEFFPFWQGGPYEIRKKKKTVAPRYRQWKAFFSGPQQVVWPKTARNPCPFIKLGTGADQIKMITD